MKKLLYLLLAFLLVVTLTACGPAITEAQSGIVYKIDTGAASESLIQPSAVSGYAGNSMPFQGMDLSRPIVALIALAFEILLAIVAKHVVPPLRRWLDARASKDQQTVLWNLIVRFVDAAEGTFGVKMGKEKMNFVQSRLRSMGYDVDTNYIEAAVKQMNDRLMFQFADGLGVTTAKLDETKDEPGVSLEITEWPLELLRDFCAANGIDATGCVSREDYVDAIGRGGRRSDEPPNDTSKETENPNNVVNDLSWEEIIPEEEVE